MTQRIEALAVSTPARKEYWGNFLDETLDFNIVIQQNRRSRSTIGSTTFQPILEIHSSDKPFLEQLTSVFPAKNPHPRYKDPKEGQYQNWNLTLRRAYSCLRFIQGIKPYLEYTRPQADIFEEFLLQKREVIRELEGLTRVPHPYSTPEDRIVAEEDLRRRFLEAKAQTVATPHLPKPTRLAGIVDAKFLMGIYVTHRQDSPYSEFPDFEAAGGLTSIHKGLLDGLHGRFGGTEPVEMARREKYHAGPSFRWQLTGPQWMPLLQSVEPYLIFKQTHAGLIIDFLRVQAAFGTPSHDPLVQAQRVRVLQSYVGKWQELIAA